MQQEIENQNEQQESQPNIEEIQIAEKTSNVEPETTQNDGPYEIEQDSEEHQPADRDLPRAELLKQK